MTVDFHFSGLGGGRPGARHTRRLSLATLQQMSTRQLLMLACAAVLASGVQAAEALPRGVFVEGGVAERWTNTSTVGLIWPWAWRRDWGGGEASGLTEVFLSHWSARGDGGRQAFTQAGVLPLLRYGFGQGRSPWFLEGGIGISLMEPMYSTPRKHFSSPFNFVDVLGVGRRFGERRSQELSLRLSHVSNGGIRRPNPGENLLQLRYAVMF
jgi:lipid A 3-O-deacylase